MDHSDTMIFVVFFAVILAVVSVITGVVYTVERASCHARWQNSVMPSRFGFFSGCLISLDGGRTWVPDASLRYFEED